jgi:hypothetical protein
MRSESTTGDRMPRKAVNLPHPQNRQSRQPESKTVHNSHLRQIQKRHPHDDQTESNRQLCSISGTRRHSSYEVGHMRGFWTEHPTYAQNNIGRVDSSQPLKQSSQFPLLARSLSSFEYLGFAHVDVQTSFLCLADC